MFWNDDFLDPSPSSIDVLLQAPVVKLSDILYEEDLLQELKTSNTVLVEFLSRPEVIAELVDNIANISEQDCSHKLLYSRIHAAYISCEILISGANGIFAAFMNDVEFLDKIFSCLIYESRCPSSTTLPSPTTTLSTTTTTDPSIQTSDTTQETMEDSILQPAKQSSTSDEKNDEPTSDDTPNHDLISKETKIVPENGLSDDEKSDAQPAIQIDVKDTNDKCVNESKLSEDDKNSPQNKVDGDVLDEKKESQNEANQNQKENHQMVIQQTEANDSKVQDNEAAHRTIMTKVVPQKAALVSKLISSIHSTSPANVVYYIRQNLETFEKFINLLVNNIDVSGSLEILSTFIKRTSPTGMRDIFSEILLDFNFIFKLIDAMTLSDSEDKQRNACQLLCDIIVIGRQEAFEQHPSIEDDILPHDSLIKNLQSPEAIKLLLTRMFEGNVRNTTAIICGMKVLQTLMERKSPPDPRAHILEQEAQQEIEGRLRYIHELLLNPPKQDPIRTTFGVIQKPLGYMRLEAVNLIRVLISTGLPVIIRKLLELGTLTVIFDLFIEYPWNNLLHSQVEQIISLVIDNSRQEHYPSVEALFNNQFGEELFLAEREVILNRKSKSIDSVEEQLNLAQHTQNSESNLEDHKPLEQTPNNDNHHTSENEQPNQNGTGTNDENHQKESLEHELEIDYYLVMKGEKCYKDVNAIFGVDFLKKMAKRNAPKYAQSIALENPSKALLIQLLEECDLIGRLLMPTLNGTNGLNSNQIIENHNNNHIDSENEDGFNSNNKKLALIRGRKRRDTGEKANFGHIIQIINAISINRDIASVDYHLSNMAKNRPELFERWNNFVNQDVLSFKSCVLFYDSSTDSIGYRLIEKPKMNKNLGRMTKNIDSITVHQLNDEKGEEWISNGMSRTDRVLLNFRSDHILPTINKNVLPRSFSTSLLPEL